MEEALIMTLLAEPAPTVWNTPTFWAAVVAAVVAAANLVATLTVSGRRARNDRLRQLCAEAYAALIEYREFAYRFRRRRANDTDERVRLSDELSACQRNLRQLEARLRVEAPAVAQAYTAVLKATRGLAGSYIREAAKAPASNSFRVDVQDIDFSPLQRLDDAYLASQRDYLTPLPRWARKVFARSAGPDRSAAGNAVEH